MAYGRNIRGLGFTEEQEGEILATQKQQAADMAELLEAKRAEDALRTFTIVATVGGCLFTLARFGEFVVSLRKRRSTDSVADVLATAEGD